MKISAKKFKKINGTIPPGFESVKQLFEQYMQSKTENNGELCVYYRGEKVIGLWRSPSNDSNFSADSLINIFSSGKSLEAIAMSWLVSKGLLSYDAKIVQYWPEFGVNSKDGLPVADLMRHEAGLANFNQSLDMQDLFTQNIKQNTIGRIIERHAQTYRGGDDRKRQYHTLTRGWIANEVFRSVDPTCPDHWRIYPRGDQRPT